MVDYIPNTQQVIIDPVPICDLRRRITSIRSARLDHTWLQSPTGFLIAPVATNTENAHT